ncbi:MAG: ExeA family protein [Pirellulaceae bacterium]|jgi:type II secretory pathway predicted ATPase ExeA
MYESYWGLTQRPFDERQDLACYYPGEAHQATLLKLRYAIENRSLSALVSGSSGMGKSLLMRCLAEQTREPAGPVRHLVYPAMGREAFLRTVASRLADRSITSIDDEAMALELLETSLADQVKAGRHPVLVIDEAQVLETHGLLEPVRLLMNLATQAGAGQAALTLILVGQPALTAHLQRHSALEERIAVRCMLPQWSDGETHAYMSHRMRWAGAPLERIFGEDAIDRICELSHGIPRLINRLADLALMVGYGEEVAQIDRRLIDSLQEEMSLPAGAEG